MKIKILTFPLRIAIIILIFGALFKIIHCPYANILMVIGGLSIGLLYSVRFFFKKGKSKLDYIKLTMIVLWVFSYLIKSFYFNFYSYIIDILLIVLFIYWFIVEGIYYFKNRKFKKNKFLKMIYYLLIGLTIFILFFGITFKIQHWPYGALLFTIGILQLNIILIFDYFIIDRRISIE